ncbi:unnamed protein product [Hyaloperonospora brassicae]|uniref:Elongation factor EFG domain-containing protein n=1 Tax=Hyaloperonospora brassicae TaxID=162125 RepID=A0AAV0T309_HYABA|nr:unnamed protein product [Hyaloperonospora brassicae]
MGDAPIYARVTNTLYSFLPLVAFCRWVLTLLANRAVDNNYKKRDEKRWCGLSGVEPVIAVEVEVISEFQGTAIAEVNRRRGLINSSDADDMHTVIKCDVPLQNMFGFSTDLRSSTQGKGEFTMEYKTHGIVMRDMQEKLMSEHKRRKRPRTSRCPGAWILLATTCA